MSAIRRIGRGSRTVAMSGNALISANIPLGGPTYNEQDLRAHTDEIVTVLSDALEDLRP